MIATAAFKIYSKNFYGFIKDDIQDYQANCEAGIFYDYFMQLNGIDANDEEARSEFKSDFFGKVFYPKIYPSDGEWLIQFKEKYPTCYEGMIDVKRGVMSENYKSFPATMTEIESAIFIPVNLEMIAMGYDVLNIHDSLYSDSQEAIELAKIKIKEKFAEIGITPLLKDINYQFPALQTPKQPVVDNYIKKDLQGSPAEDTENTVKPQPKEIQKPIERFLTNEAKEKGLQELSYFIDEWEHLVGLEIAYQMYEDQFKGMNLKPKVLLKAV